MELAMLEKTGYEECFNPIFTESFICEGNLYNASYIPTDELPTTIMLEKVIKYPDDKIYFKNKINMVFIHVINAGKIRIEFNAADESLNEIALACATAAYKFDLVKNYLVVEVIGTDISIPFHINSSNR